MSEISIQIRRVTERVNEYFRLFGFLSFAKMQYGKSVIRAKKRIGMDEIECVVAETARGTSIGFYAVNSLQGLIYSLPFLFVLILHLINLIPSIGKYISGDNAFFNINWLYVFSGNATLNFQFILITLLLAAIPAMMDFIQQRIRLSNLKSRFSFFSKRAIWDTREIPNSMIIFRASRTVLTHGWLLAILYFGIFGSTDDTLNDLTGLYNTTNEQLLYTLSNTFTITIGLAIGLLSGIRALEIRKENARFDKRSRITGNLLERRIDPILFSVQASAVTSILFTAFMSVTYMQEATMQMATQLIIMSIIGGFIAGFVHSEGYLWISMTYAIFIFFTSVVFIFQTGKESAYGFVIVLQLFLLPVPFLLYLSLRMEKVLERYDVKDKEWLFENIPLLSIIMIRDIKRKQKSAKEAYLETLNREVAEEDIPDAIYINKSVLMDRNSAAHRIALHYYELLLSYTASFDDDTLVYIPTTTQLTSWWKEKSKKPVKTEYKQFIRLTDRLLWDPEYNPDNTEIIYYEPIGQEMVLAIK